MGIDNSCIYVPDKWVDGKYSRRRYKTSCRFQFVNLNEEINTDGKWIRNPPKGKCMKCKKEIKMNTNKK